MTERHCAGEEQQGSRRDTGRRDIVEGPRKEIKVNPRIGDIAKEKEELLRNVYRMAQSFKFSTQTIPGGQ